MADVNTKKLKKSTKSLKKFPWRRYPMVIYFDFFICFSQNVEHGTHISPGTPGGKWALRGFLRAVEVVQRLDLVVEVYQRLFLYSNDLAFA